MSRPKFVLTEQHMIQLRELCTGDTNLGAAAQALGVAKDTLRQAIRDSKYCAEITSKLFPQMGYKRKTCSKPVRPTESRVISLEELRAEPPEVDTSLLHVRAAIMHWRKVA